MSSLSNIERYARLSQEVGEHLKGMIINWLSSLGSKDTLLFLFYKRKHPGEVTALFKCALVRHIISPHSNICITARPKYIPGSPPAASWKRVRVLDNLG